MPTQFTLWSVPVRVWLPQDWPHYYMKQLLCAGFSLLTLLLLTACNGVSLFSNEHRQQMDRLEAAVTLCVSSSEQSRQQLQRQSEQLVIQGQKLDALSDAAAEAANAANVAKAPILNTKDLEQSTCIAVEAEPSKMLVGRHEQVWIEDIQLALPARVDTGAETASLDARNIEMFERNGRRWVRFEILHPDSGEALLLERKLRRTVSIIQSNTSEPERRPVIKLGITIGHVKQSAEFTLSNRSHLDYQMLVGRNILKDVMIVDVSKINIAPPVLGE